MGSAYSIDGANTVNTDDDEQKIFTADDTSLTITNSATLSRSGVKSVGIDNQDNSTLTVHSGSTVTATGSNAVSATGWWFSFFALSAVWNLVAGGLRK